jgi:hypothetical protein
MQASLALEQKQRAIDSLLARVDELIAADQSKPAEGGVDSTVSRQQAALEAEAAQLRAALAEQQATVAEVSRGQPWHSHWPSQHLTGVTCSPPPRPSSLAVAHTSHLAPIPGADCLQLAELLASREASHVALVETIEAYMAHQLPSMPPTPRGAPTPGEEAPNEEQRFQAMVSFWQARLAVQAEQASRKLRGEADDGCEEEEALEDGMCSDGKEQQEDGQDRDAVPRKATPTPAATPVKPLQLGLLPAAHSVAAQAAASPAMGPSTPL